MKKVVFDLTLIMLWIEFWLEVLSVFTAWLLSPDGSCCVHTSDGHLSCSEHQCTLDLTALCVSRNHVPMQAMFQQYPPSNFLILILNQNTADASSKMYWLGFKSFCLVFYSNIFNKQQSVIDIRSGIFHSAIIGTKRWFLVCSLHWTNWVVLDVLCTGSRCNL